MTRIELYSLVWELPLIHLAKRFGISNARLKKICEDYEVPVPPAGYWAKRAAGKTIERPALPSPTPSIFRKLNSALRRLGEIPLQIADSQIDEFDIKPFAGRVDEPPQSRTAALHPRAERLKHALAVAPVDSDGFVASNDPALPIVRVSPGLIVRATLLVDVMIRVLQQRGHNVHPSGAFRLVVSDETFELKIYETRQRISDRSSPSLVQPVEPRRFRASGKLCMEVSDPGELQWSSRNLVGQWHDRRDKPLEASLDRAADAVEAAAKQVQYFRMRARERDQLAHAETETLRANAAKAQRGKQEAEFLQRNATAYTRLLELRNFAAFLTTMGSSSDNETIGRMLKRISALVEEIESQLAPERLAVEAQRFDLFLGDDAGDD